MLHRIISSDGIVVHAKNQELYSIISCIDGLDYIIEIFNNEKNWKLYNFSDDNKNENHINITETELPLLENSQDDIEINVKKKGRKYKVVCDDNDNEYKPNLNQNIITEEVIGVKKTIKIIKKKGRPPKKTPVEIIESESSEEEIIIKKKGRPPKKTQVEIIESESSEKEIIIKKKGRPPKKPLEEIIIKKVIKLKEKVQNIVIENDNDKKLSDYHIFIKEFLSKNNNIVWNKRMKAANESWKNSK